MSNFLNSHKRVTSGVRKDCASHVSRPKRKEAEKCGLRPLGDVSRLFLLVVIFLIAFSTFGKSPEFPFKNDFLDTSIVTPALNSGFKSFLSFLLIRGTSVLKNVFRFSVQKIIEPATWVISLDAIFITVVGFFVYNLEFLNQNDDQNRSNCKNQLNAGNSETPNHGIYLEKPMKWPKVLVQLPMYNELLVYERSIEKVCSLNYPKELLYIQVLDDSTMEDLSLQMKECVHEWKAKGLNIFYRHRKNRLGYKAGNLKEGLCETYVKDCEFVAILDADFEPSPDWLQKAIIPLVKDPSLSLIQTRWTFSNSNECLLTKCQEIELKWHFLAEQLTSSFLFNFFGFNGSGGIWRTSVIWEAGNWKDDTTVEDMDMAICSTLKGYKFKLLPRVECLSELPSTWKAYRKQQHRWTSGPASLLRLRFRSVLSSHSVNFWLKAYILGVYIGLRRGLKNVVNLSLWIILPLWALFPSLLSHRPPYALLSWLLIHPICLFIFSPKSLHFLPIYSILMNTMSILRFQALVSGLFNFSSSKTWDVTFKTGSKQNPNQKNFALNLSLSSPVNISPNSNSASFVQKDSNGTAPPSDLVNDSLHFDSPLLTVTSVSSLSSTLSPTSSLSPSSSLSSPSSRSPSPSPPTSAPLSPKQVALLSPQPLSSSLLNDHLQLDPSGKNQNEKQNRPSFLFDLSIGYEIAIGLLLLISFFLFQFGNGFEYFTHPSSILGISFSFWIIIQSMVFIIAGLGYVGLNGV